VRARATSATSDEAQQEDSADRAKDAGQLSHPS
jgi:hypothetical protein